MIEEKGTEVISLGQLIYKCTTLENQVAVLRASSVLIGRGSDKLDHGDTSQGYQAGYIL